MPHFQLFAFTSPAKGREDEFNNWYTNTHLTDVLRVPGVKSAQRFRLTEKQRDAPLFPQSYLAIYECEAESVDDVLQALAARSGTDKMPLSDALAESRMVVFYEPVTEKKVAP